MYDPLGSTGAHVVEGFTGTCNNVKFSSTGSIKDSNGSNSWNMKVPLTDCAIAESQLMDQMNGNNFIDYTLYWNSQALDSKAEIF